MTTDDAPTYTFTTPQLVSFLEQVLQAEVNELWKLWQAQPPTAAPTPVKATLVGTELTIKSMPARVTRRRVLRDQQGRITETIDIEEDAQ